MARILRGPERMELRLGKVGVALLIGVPVMACDAGAPLAQWCGPPEPVAARVLPPRGGDGRGWAVAPWPGEPAALKVVSDDPFTGLNQGGWYGEQRDTTNGSGLTVALDPAAPHSPSTALAFGYAAGFPGGTSPGVAFYRLPTPARETYFGFWWKPSNPWQNHAESGVNKIALVFPETPGAGTVYIMMYFDGTKYTIQTETTFATDTRRLEPKLAATPVVLGEWHQIGWYVKYSTTATSRDGVVMWWVNGVLQGAYTDLQMPADGGILEYQIAPVWGGVGGVKLQTDCFWFDHARISIR